MKNKVIAIVALSLFARLKGNQKKVNRGALILDPFTKKLFIDP
jgi:hypothetical protein